MWKITYFDFVKSTEVWYMNIGFKQKIAAEKEMSLCIKEESKLHEFFKSRENFKVKPIKHIVEP